MDQLAPNGPIYQAGTLSGNPVAMAAGLATLEIVSQPGFFDALGATTADLTHQLRRCAAEAGVPLTTNHLGGMFGIFFTEEAAVTSFAAVMRADQERFKRFFHGMIEAGVYLAPSAFEAGFVSSAHGPAEIAATIEAARKVLATL